MIHYDTQYGVQCSITVCCCANQKVKEQKENITKYSVVFGMLAGRQSQASAGHRRPTPPRHAARARARSHHTRHIECAQCIQSTVSLSRVSCRRCSRILYTQPYAVRRRYEYEVHTGRTGVTIKTSHRAHTTCIFTVMAWWDDYSATRVPTQLQCPHGSSMSPLAAPRPKQ
jgi:hypothetical protein